MKRFFTIILTAQLIFSDSFKLFSQSTADMQEFGITIGALTNFPADKNYLDKYINVFYLAPYIRVGRHEFSAGMSYPLQTHALFFDKNLITPRPGAVAGYKFYIFNVYGRENLFVHYTFQYLRFKKTYDSYFMWNNQTYLYNTTETDTYINNVIGLGYNLFFDMNGRFGFYYILDYVITQTGYKVDTQGPKSNSWTTNYIWNNLSTHLGFSFKLTSLKKKAGSDPEGIKR
jgi:hypothetical protein